MSTHCVVCPGALIAPKVQGGKGLLRVRVTKKILSVICSNMRFLTWSQHIICKFSSRVSNYIQQKFHLKGETPDWGWERVPAHPLRTAPGSVSWSQLWALQNNWTDWDAILGVDASGSKVKFGHVVSEIWDRPDRQTGILIIVLRTSPRGGSSNKT